MTYRERRQARAEQRREWAAARAARADAAHATARTIHETIPFGQPILVGHHSEGRHRRDIARFSRSMDESVESSKMAARHEQAADEIERQLDNAIYDDDPDAVERLTEKIARLEGERDRMKAENSEYRREHKTELAGMTAWQKDQALPHASYTISNRTANIGRLRKRLEGLQRFKQAEAEGRVRYRRMTAKYGGSCDRCGTKVERGDTMFWNRRAAERMLCSGCGEEA